MPVINSFTQSPAVTQILGYIFVLMGILVFYICITPHMNNIPANITLSVLFGISTIILIVFSVLSSYIDPSDSIVKQYYEALKNQKPFNSLNYAYCNICQSYCDKSSKHCHSCQRCAYGFDHHCIWINNCIGQNNYRYFIVMTSFVVIKLGIFIAASVYISLEQRFNQYFGAMIAIWVYTLIALIMGSLALGLLVFHIYFYFKGITTYQYIILRKQQQTNKKRFEQRKVFDQQFNHSKQNLQDIVNKPKSQNIHKLSGNDNLEIQMNTRSYLEKLPEDQKHSISYNKDNLSSIKRRSIEKASQNVSQANYNPNSEATQSKSFPKFNPSNLIIYNSNKSIQSADQPPNTLHQQQQQIISARYSSIHTNTNKN